jgi:3',5'-cyclic AMP phosphodiesterase CpdA
LKSASAFVHMAKFRLLQITDLHITVPPEEDALGSRALWISYQWVFPSRARLQPLQAVADLVDRLRNIIDTIVISGDIADDGETRNLSSALDFLTARPVLGTYMTSDEWPTLHHASNNLSTFARVGQCGIPLQVTVHQSFGQRVDGTTS